MSESTKPVFLSYASQDAEAVQHICDALRAAGLEVWFDRNELRGGDARYPAAIALLQSFLEKSSAIRALSRGSALSALGAVQRFAGDAVNAKANYSQARELFDASLREQPDNAFLISWIAGMDAGLGNRDLALKEAGHAMELLPASKDALEGPALEEGKARVLALFGEKDGAIAALQHLLTTPYEAGSPPITSAVLRLDPSWDPLRGDPRFEKLCQEPDK